MNLDQYLALARRCACFAVAPTSLSAVLDMLDKASADIEKAYYWKKSATGSGILLVQSASNSSLHTALGSMKNYPRHCLPFTRHNQKNKVGLFTLPSYRICSNPSIWPSGNLIDPLQVDLLQLQPNAYSNSSLMKNLLRQSSVTEQMQYLVQATSLSHPLRLLQFTFSDSLQELLESIRPNSRVYPFGSAINGLGTRTSDLDLTFNLGLNVHTDLELLANYYNDNRPSNSGIIFSKKISILPHFLTYSGRKSDKILSPVKNLLSLVDPLATPSSRILGAKIPIINFPKHRLLGVGIDISCGCDEDQSSFLALLAAFWMNSLVTNVPLFLFLACTLKFIMRIAQVTQCGPTHGFTSYKLTCLLLHFLQVIGYAPALQHLLNNGFTCIEDITASFLIPQGNDTPCPLEAPDILNEFFTYLQAMDPQNRTICLMSGRLLPRTESSPHFIYCPNPTSPTHNILHNIDFKSWLNLLSVIKNMQKSLLANTGEASVRWGLTAVSRAPL